MSKRDDIIKIYKEGFHDSEEYIKLVFDSVYKDSEAMTVTDIDGSAASGLMLRQFEMTFHGQIMPVSYIFGASTRRAQRGKGFMTMLVRDAIMASAERGDMLCTLIPANDALYFYYEMSGFSKVFYIKEQRFTSLHSFPVEKEYEVMTDWDIDRVWEAFNRFQLDRECYILHSKEDFRNILDDNRIDRGNFVVLVRHDDDLGPVIASMAWAVVKNDLLVVTDLMGESVDARLAAMRQLRGIHSDLPFLLYGRPTDKTGGRLMPRGMGRIVNVEKCLMAVANANGKIKTKIRVHDPLLSELNSHIYIIEDGICRIDDSFPGRLDFDVSIDVLNRIVFNSAETSDVIGFPSVRPMISLMLD